MIHVRDFIHSRHVSDVGFAFRLSNLNFDENLVYEALIIGTCDGFF